MQTRAPRRFGSLLPVAVATALAPALAPAQSCHDLAGIAAIAGELLAAAPVSGASCVRVEQRGAVQFEQCFGSYGPATVVPIASATKTLSAAVLLSLVDSGVLSLDDRVGQYLPEWDVGAKAQITLRMCFAHTSGMVGGDPAIGDATLTLRQAAMALANVPLRAAPGAEFFYGGVSMHVAGAVCEVASGQSWAQLFAQRIAQPLGMTATDYAAFGPTANPRIAGGARSNLGDFAAFVGMLRTGGSWQGHQVLSAASVAAMTSDQTGGAVIVSTPHPDAAPYGVGIWLDRRDSQGRTLLASAVGAFGFTGWIDRAHDASGVFAVRYLNQVTRPYVERIWAECDAALLPDGVACVGAGSPPCRDGAWLNGSSAARAGEPDFALLASRAPAGALGGIVLGPPAPGGLPFGDLTAFVGPAIDAFAIVVADAGGRARLPAPLGAALAGATLGVQGVWLDPAPCTAQGLAASHALAITVVP